jgi:hypothetical protein
MSTSSVPGISARRPSGSPDLVKADPDRLHKHFEAKGGFERFREVVDLPARSARLIWEDPDRKQSNRRNRISFTAVMSFNIAAALGISWPELMEDLYHLEAA